MKNSAKNAKALDLVETMKGKTSNFGSIKIWIKVKLTTETIKPMDMEPLLDQERLIFRSRECKSGVWVQKKISKTRKITCNKEMHKL